MCSDIFLNTKHTVISTVIFAQHFSTAYKRASITDSTTWATHHLKIVRMSKFALSGIKIIGVAAAHISFTTTTFTRGKNILRKWPQQTIIIKQL